jgi:hypothetical protein
LFKSKDKTFEIFKYYKNKVENQFDKKIKAIKSDRDEEYKIFFGELCLQNTNIHKITAFYLPQQNDIAEYKN